MAISRSRRRFILAWVALGALLAGPVISAQLSPVPPATPGAQAEPAKDSLGRDTPRGAVLGFMSAARDGRDDVAPQYLNTRLRGQEAVDLARELYAVLDSRLPARLSNLSDRPEGSLGNPLKPNEDVIGTITTGNGPLDLVLERVSVPGPRLVWLFSRTTLDAIPDVYSEIRPVSIERFLPSFLVRPQVAGIRLFEWLALGLLFPLSYRLWGLLGRLVRPAVVSWHRRRRREGEVPANPVPGPVWLLFSTAVIRWLLSVVELPLLERVFWSGVATMLGIGGLVWALLWLNGSLQRHFFRRFQDSGRGEMVAMLGLGRRMMDVLALAAGGLLTLHYFGVNPTAALAGLGIGGIAVALAAQKTLENVIGGLSIVLDEAVRVGDFLKLGETPGTVEYIGLRSTRIRTLDRTMLSVPNGQIANANIETLSDRDKFWFHHVVGLGYETSSSQMRSIIDGIRAYLAAHAAIDRNEAVRVRFFRLGPSSLDVELSAYVAAGDWGAFLETQQELLLAVMEIVAGAGAKIALPSQTLHVTDGRLDAPDTGRTNVTRSAPPDRPALASR